jgi:hypothetical protein
VYSLSKNLGVLTIAFFTLAISTISIPTSKIIPLFIPVKKIKPETLTDSRARFETNLRLRLQSKDQPFPLRLISYPYPKNQKAVFHLANPGQIIRSYASNDRRRWFNTIR